VWNDKVVAAIDAEGTAYFSGTTTCEGRRAMRISVCNWQTSREDVVRTVAAVKRVLEKLRKDYQLARAKSSLITASLQQT
jgi:hypothetical protein